MKLDWLNKAVRTAVNFPDIQLLGWPGVKSEEEGHFGDRVDRGAALDQWGDVSTAIADVADGLAKLGKGYIAVEHGARKARAKQDLDAAIKIIQSTRDLRAGWKHITSNYKVSKTKVGTEVRRLLKGALRLSNG